MTGPNPNDVKRFQEAVDRRLSGMEGDPWLAKKIIAAEKEEKKVKKKISAGLALALALACAFAFALAEAWPEIGTFLDEKGITAHRDLIARQPSGNTARGSTENGTDNHTAPLSTVLPITTPETGFLNIWVDRAESDGNSLRSSSIMIEPFNSGLAVFEELEPEYPEGWNGEDEPPLEEKLLLVDDEYIAISEWRGGRQMVECFVSLYSKAGVPSDLAWVYRVENHTLSAGKDRLTLRVGLLAGLQPEMFRDDPLYLHVKAVNLQTDDTQDAYIQLAPSDLLAFAETAASTTAAAQASVLFMVTPAPAPAQMGTAELHGWLFEKAWENALALWEMSRSDAYLTAAGYQTEDRRTLDSLTNQDFSRPTAMRLYSVSLDGLGAFGKEQIEKEENPAVLAETMRCLMRTLAPIGNMGENAASETVRLGSFLNRTWAYPQPGNVGDMLVWLEFEGDYSVCCAFTAFPDGTVLCDSGVAVQDLPGGLFTRMASYEGAALELLGGGNGPK